jgi:sulfopyruvate decarboxylase alpha subunit
MARAAHASPPTAADADDWPDRLHVLLREQQVRQVAFVPDAGHTRLIRLCEQDNTMRAVRLTTEEEGIAQLMGAWLGGERGVLLMQSSGVGNCINMLSLSLVCHIPLLMIVTMRGDWGEFNPWQVPMGQGTPKVLDAMGVAVSRASRPEDVVETVSGAARIAFNASCPAAVLIGQNVLGAKDFKELAKG